MPSDDETNRRNGARGYQQKQLNKALRSFVSSQIIHLTCWPDLQYDFDEAVAMVDRAFKRWAETRDKQLAMVRRTIER